MTRDRGRPLTTAAEVFLGGAGEMAPLLQKPFSPDALAGTVAGLLLRRRPRG